MGRPLIFSRRSAAWGAALAAAVALLFLPATRNGFIFLDDGDYLTENRQVQVGLVPAVLRWSFTTFANANWHPLTWVSHAADVQLFGLAPAGHHLTSLLIHAANTVLVFLAVRSLTGARAASWLAALLFGVHPLRVESVAWAAERKDVLSAFFFLAALLAWSGSLRRPRRRGWQLATVLLFALGLLSKPMPVTFPFVLLLLEWWPVGRLAGRGPGPPVPDRRAILGALVEKLPLFALSLASSAVTLVAQRAGRGLRSFDEIPLGQRVANALDAPVGYLLHTLWPADLSVFYLHPLGGLPPWRPVLGAAVLAAGTVFVALRARRLPMAAAGWCWFLGTLVPVIGLVQVGAQAMADRYTYLPHVGLALAGAGFAALSTRCGGRMLRAAVPACFLVVVAFGAATARQLTVWRDSETLLRHAVEVEPANPVAILNLAVLLGRSGSYRQAETTFRGLFRIAPRWRRARYEHGLLAVTVGDREAALADLAVLREIDPPLAERFGRYLAAVGWIPQPR